MKINTAFTLFFGVFLLGCGSDKQGQDNNSPAPAPNFELKDFLTDNTVKLSDFKGKPVIINFWFAGCPPCRWEAPSLKKFAEANTDIAVLSITEPKNNEEGAIKQFLDEFGWQFPVLLDDTGKVTAMFDENMVYPTMFLVSKGGEIVGKIVNYIEWDTLEMKDIMENLRNSKLIWYYRYLRRLK